MGVLCYLCFVLGAIFILPMAFNDACVFPLPGACFIPPCCFTRTACLPRTRASSQVFAMGQVVTRSTHRATYTYVLDHVRHYRLASTLDVEFSSSETHQLAQDTVPILAYGRSTKFLTGACQTWMGWYQTFSGQGLSKAFRVLHDLLAAQGPGEHVVLSTSCNS